jgi:hypothetical protein
MELPNVWYYFTLWGVAFLALISPILVAAFLVAFKGRGVYGRWLFLVAGPILAYSILWVFTLVVIVPATFVVVFLAPATKDLFNQMPYWFSVAAWATEYQWLLASLACGGLATWLAKYVWPRWPAILFALVKPPSDNGLT